jgi:hypothetical protein
MNNHTQLLDITGASRWAYRGFHSRGEGETALSRDIPEVHCIDQHSKGADQPDGVAASTNMRSTQTSFGLS